jgi:hypothetical protein
MKNYEWNNSGRDVAGDKNNHPISVLAYGKTAGKGRPGFKQLKYPPRPRVACKDGMRTDWKGA